MKVAFRVDASREIGTGHVMRCLSLADALRRRGALVLFLCRSHPGHLGGFIRARGFEVRRLPGAASKAGRGGYAAWLGVSWRRDADQTRAALAGGCDWLVVDHYALDRGWEERVRPAARRILAVDDLPGRRHAADLLLDQNRSAPRRSRPGLLRGPRYALLRPEFHRTRLKVRPREGSVRRLFIFFGGVDAAGETAKAIEAVERLDRRSLSADVVIGGLNPRAAALRKRLRDARWARAHEDVQAMAPLMARADLALGAAGTTSWERCCLGLPSIVVTVAENQSGVAAALRRSGAALSLGLSRNISAAALARVLGRLMDDPSRLRKMSRKAWVLADGLGTERVADAMAAAS